MIVHIKHTGGNENTETITYGSNVAEGPCDAVS